MAPDPVPSCPPPGLPPKRPAPKATIETWLDEYAVREPAGGLMDDIAEVAWLSDTFGVATAARWHEHVKAGSTRESANRTWQRLRAALVEHGVPHELVPAGKMTGVRITVPRHRLESFSLPLKRCMRKVCPAHEAPIPARPPFYYRNKANPDGLDAICANCRRAKPQAAKTTESQRAAHRRYNQSAAGRARKSKHRSNSSTSSNKLGNDIHVPLNGPYGHATNGVATPLDPEGNAADSAILPTCSLGQQQTPGTTSMPASNCMSISQLSKHLSDVLGRDVPEYTITYLLKRCPEYEPPRVFENRAFYPEHVAAIRDVFAAGLTPKGVKAAKAAKAKAAARAAPAG